MRASGQVWFLNYKNAFVSHMQDKYYYWGMLIRDTLPSLKDVEYSVNQTINLVSQNIPTEFIAIYSELPIIDWPKHCRSGGTI
jgi:hypothetical protein